MNIALLLIAAVIGPMANDEAAAQADRDRFPQEEHNHLYYASTARVPPGVDRENLDTALKWVLLHASSPDQTAMRSCIPVPITPTCYRIDLNQFGWDSELWKQVTKDNPYSRIPDSLVLPADWLVMDLSDVTRSDSYQLLVYGGVPKTREDVFRILKVAPDLNLRHGYVETESQVAVNKVRRIESIAKLAGDAWLTRDILERTLEKDPMEQLEGDFIHDGEELIVSCEKHDVLTRQAGLVQYYALFNGKGIAVPEAPVDLVTDHTRFRGYHEITYPGGCFQCHITGLREPTEDGVARIFDRGVNAYANYFTQQSILRFYFRDLKKEIRRHNEDFAIPIQIACGTTPSAAIARFMMATKRYDEDLDLDRVAWESGASPDELRLAMAWSQTAGFRLPASAAALVQGGTISRDAIEQGAGLAIRDIHYHYKENP